MSQVGCVVRRWEQSHGWLKDPAFDRDDVAQMAHLSLLQGQTVGQAYTGVVDAIRAQNPGLRHRNLLLQRGLEDADCGHTVTPDRILGARRALAEIDAMPGLDAEMLQVLIDGHGAGIALAQKRGHANESWVSRQAKALRCKLRAVLSSHIEFAVNPQRFVG